MTRVKLLEVARVGGCCSLAGPPPTDLSRQGWDLLQQALFLQEYHPKSISGKFF